MGKNAFRKAYALVGAILSLNAAQASAAEIQSVTIFAKNDPHFSEGGLTMCSVYFSTLFMDESLRNRAFIAEGTIGFVFNDGGPDFSPFTKVHVGEQVERDGKATAVPLPISNPVITGADSIGTDKFQSVDLHSPDSPYAHLKKYKMSDLSNHYTFIDLMSTNNLILKFNLQENGKFYSIPVDLTMIQNANGKDEHSALTMRNFSSCMLEMVNIARARIKN